jgi:hypothetical protein
MSICLILSQPEVDLIRKFSLTFVFNVFFNNPCGVIFQEKSDPYTSQTGHVCLNFLISFYLSVASEGALFLLYTALCMYKMYI